MGQIRYIVRPIVTRRFFLPSSRKKTPLRRLFVMQNASIPQKSLRMTLP